MGCNCGPKGSQTQVWTYVSEDGSVRLTNLSEVQAKAEKIRRGGGVAQPA